MIVAWLCGLIGMAASGAVGGARLGADAGRADQQSAVTVWSGVYTDAQAERGKAYYAKECASCHAVNLQGGDEAPGLSGAGFLSPWMELSVADLHERIRVTMPQDRPGQLSRAVVSDIVAYLFKANEFPAGSRELASDAAALKQIAIVAKPAP